MADSDSSLEIIDSPTENPPRSKKAFDDGEMPPPKYSLLESVSGRFEQNQKENQYRSPETPPRSKRGLDDGEMPPPKYSLLESVSARFEQNQKENQYRLQIMKNKREAELVHSRYLRTFVVSPADARQAEPVVQRWAAKHNILGRNARNILRSRNTVISETATQMPAMHRPISVNSRNFPNNIPKAEQGSYAANATRQLIKSDPDERDTILIEETFTCSVRNCGAVFSSAAAKVLHDQGFKHSPCNPCITMPDCHLPSVPTAYICPICSLEFDVSDDCKVHMLMDEQNEFLDPLGVGGYTCPECLCIFSVSQACEEHMSSKKHTSYAYPFAEDTTQHAEPAVMPMELAREFLYRCLNVTFSVSCEDCGLMMTNQKELQQHRKETLSQHIVCAYAESNPGEVFAEYLCEFTCTFCRQMLAPSGGRKLGDEHHCARGQSGTIIDNDCKTFSEFLRRCGITAFRKLRL